MGCWTHGLIDWWTVGLYCWTDGLLNGCTDGMFERWTEGLMGCWTILVVWWNVGQMEWGIDGLLDYTVELLDCGARLLSYWAVGLLSCGYLNSQGPASFTLSHSYTEYNITQLTFSHPHPLPPLDSLEPYSNTYYYNVHQIPWSHIHNTQVRKHMPLVTSPQCPVTYSYDIGTPCQLSNTRLCPFRGVMYFLQKRVTQM